MSARSYQIRLHATILTIFATFLMGFVDAFTYIKYDGVFVSAQTGNVIVMSVKLFSEEWLEAAKHLSVFAGFGLGTFIGQAVIEKVNSQSIKQFRIFLVIQGALLLFLSVLQLTIPGSIIVFLLGTLSGYELSVFRRIGVTTINNGIMTGNTKNMMHHLYKWVFDKNNKSGIHFKNFVLGFMTFIIGVVTGSQIVRWNSEMILWIALIMNTILFILFYFMRNKCKQHEK